MSETGPAAAGASIKNAEKLIRSAGEAAAAGDHDSAAALLREAVSEDPSNTRAWRALGEELSKTMGGLTEASECFARAEKLFGESGSGTGEKLHESYISLPGAFLNPYTYVWMACAAAMVAVSIILTYSFLGVIVMSASFVLLLFSEPGAIFKEGLHKAFAACLAAGAAAIACIYALEKMFHFCKTKTGALLAITRRTVNIRHSGGSFDIDISKIARITLEKKEDENIAGVVFHDSAGRVIYTAKNPDDPEGIVKTIMAVTGIPDPHLSNPNKSDGYKGGGGHTEPL